MVQDFRFMVLGRVHTGQKYVEKSAKVSKGRELGCPKSQKMTERGNEGNFEVVIGRNAVIGGSLPTLATKA
jgi:hypothetical protein